MSFRAKLILAFVALQTIVLTLVIIVNLRFVTENMRAFQAQRITSQAELLQSAIADPLLGYDYGTVASIVDALAATGSVRRVEVFGANGARIALAERPDSVAESMASQSIFVRMSATLLDGVWHPISLPVEAAGFPVGNIELTPDPSRPILRVAGMLRTSALGGLLGIAALGVASWIAGLWFSSRLRVLSDGASRIAKGAFDFRLSLPGSDEISATAAAINTKAASLIKKSDDATELALTDSLTGLPNRIGFSQALERLDRMRRPIAVLHIDLDRFKIINDTRGHAAGDEVLKTVAQNINRLVRAGAILGRIGGDEFILAFVDDNPEMAALALGNRIVRAASHPVPFGEVQLRVGASVGIATAGPGPHGPQFMARLAEDADIALYQAKTGGRGCVAVYNDATRAARESEAALELEIAQALKQDEFVPFIQPQIDSRTGVVTGAEILARWIHPDQGVILPTEFLIPLRNAAYADAIDEMVRDKALRWMASGAVGARPPQLSLNLTQMQLIRVGFAKQFIERLERLGVAASQIALEVTENMVLDKDPEVAKNLEALKSAGFLIALDDFGSGTVSLKTITQMHVDQLKLDYDFVSGLDRNPVNFAIVRAMADIASSLRIEVIAEGVESEVENEILQDLGIFIVQGFLFARPMEVGAYKDWVSDGSHNRGLSQKTSDLHKTGSGTRRSA